MKNIWNKIDKKILIILFVAICIFASNLFDGYYKGSDTTFHLSHLLAYASNFSFADLFGGDILPKVANDFGYGTRIFYAPLGYNIVVLIYSFIKYFGFGIILAIKLSYLLTLFLSGLFMYLFVNKVFKNKWVGLLSAVFYMSFPYHMLDIFFRDAISEVFFFTFIPLIFLGLEYLFENKNKYFYICFVSGYVFSTCSHLVLSIYLTGFVFLYLILNYKKVLNKKAILSLIISAVIILLLVSPFVIPLAEHMLNGNYMVFEYGFMATKESLASFTLDLGDIFYFPTEGDTAFYTFSYVVVIAFIVVLFCGYQKIDNKSSYIKFIILLFIGLFMVTRFFPWDKLPSFLISIQFPYRIEVFICFFMSILAALIVLLVKRNNQKIIVTILSCISVIFAIYLVNLHNYDEIDLKKVQTSGIGETWGLEYLPAKAYYNRDYILERNNKIKIINGEAKIDNYVNETPELSFDIETEKATLELPRIYYLGYEIELDGKKINYYENDNGFIQIDVNNSGTVTLKYVGTTGHKIALCLFTFAIVIIIGYFVFTRKKEIILNKLNNKRHRRNAKK